MFKVKTLAVLFPPYPREMRTNSAKFKSAAILSLVFSMEMVQPIPTRALSHARGLSTRTHLTAVWGMVLLPLLNTSCMEKTRNLIHR